MVQCCICSKVTPMEALREHEPFAVKRCKKCGLVFLDEAEADQHGFVKDAAAQLEEDKDHKQVEYWSFPQMYQRHEVVFHQYFRERLERLRQYTPTVKQVLDIGCGFGFFMDYLRKEEIEVTGIDIDPESIAYARETMGLSDVSLTSFEDYESHERYDAIVACDVLEHVSDPNYFVKKCKDYLNPHGTIYLQVPNVLGDVIPGDGSYNWPYHLWQFNPTTLSRLLTNHDYKVVNWWTGVMGVIGVYEKGGPDAATQASWEIAQQEKRGNRLQMLAKVVK